MTKLYEITVEEKRLRVSRIHAETTTEAETRVLGGAGCEQFNQCFHAHVVKVQDLGLDAIGSEDSPRGEHIRSRVPGG